MSRSDADVILAQADRLAAEAARLAADLRDFLAESNTPIARLAEEADDAGR